jgi:chromosome segregation ATPase
MAVAANAEAVAALKLKLADAQAALDQANATIANLKTSAQAALASQAAAQTSITNLQAAIATLGG